MVLRRWPEAVCTTPLSRRYTFPVTSRRADGQNAVVALVEVDPSISPRMFLIADRQADRALAGVEGPWRAIIPDDRRHARWILGLVSNTVETLQD